MTTFHEDRCSHGVTWYDKCQKCDDNWVAQDLKSRAAREWERGIPPRGGSYLVFLADGDQCVTRWNDGGENHQGERVKPGWPCLGNTPVVAWQHLLPPPKWF
jgi:hypothetical protein